ncbi:phage tail tape measure protein [Zhenhengia yiwuensis]|uniref:Phage tail tape measure protein n=1 Tax=Zhenhengia yiwuensis TaxID=2763666 RepID=A0A926EN22_9FIRM|nr:phage tail tape measure protein [Zhenhengia yiwuensis]MBC8581058.1 phage tail tape measure protein [Zhenhengia yiwuensis]
MSSLDLGTLLTHVKVDGAREAQKDLNNVADSTERVEKKSGSVKATIQSLGNGFLDAVKNINLFGMSVGDIASGMGDASIQSGLLGGAMAALVSTGVQLAIQAFMQLISVMKELIVQTFEVGVAFQAQMSKVAAISGATNKEFEELVKGARKFGAETVFSATEAAQALEYTSLAGWNVQESMDGLPGILNLAAAASMDLGKASDIVTDYLTAFGLEVKESTRLADVMAYAMSNSNTNVEQLGEAYKNSASTARAFGLSVEEATAWLSKMADAGVKGGEAGTALNSVLARLYGQNKIATDAMTAYGLSMYEANGKAKSFTQVMGEMQDAMTRMTEAEKNSFLRDVAGTNQLAAFTTMLAASADEVTHFTSELENATGTSERMAKTITDNIDGLQKAIGSKFESIQLSLFSVFEPLISGILKLFNSVANWWDKLVGGISGYMSKWVGQITPFIDVVVAIFDTLVDLVWPLIEPLFLLIEAMFGKNLESLKTMGNACIAVIGEIKNALMPFVEFFNNTMMVAVDLFTGNWESAMERMELLSVLAIQGVVNAILLIPNAFIAVINAVVDGMNDRLGTSIKKLDYIRADIVSFYKEAKKGSEELAEGADQALTDVADSVSSSFVDMEKSATDSIEKISDAYSNYFNKQMSEYEKQLREQFNGGTLAEEKKIQRKLALHEEMLKRQLEEDEKYEKRRAELEAKYRKVTVTNGNSTSISYVPRNANGTSYFSGGLTRMNEVGPELMFVERGAKIVNNHETREMFNNIADNSGVENRLDTLISAIQKVERVIKMLPSEQQMLARGGLV